MSSDVVFTDRFVFFYKGWPSQWHRRDFVVDGVRYNCAEQYMMAEKARVFRDGEMLERILATPSPKEQKAFGRQVRGFDEKLWQSVCRGIVYSGNLARFSQNSDIASLLLETGDRAMVEASEDCIWGSGVLASDPRALDPDQWPGKNWLGVALTQVRETISAQRAGKEPDLPGVLRKQLEAREALKAKWSQ